MAYNCVGLEPLRSKPEKAARIATFDVETFGIGGDPYACAMYDGKKISMWDGGFCIDDFLNEFLRKKNAGIIFYAHNGGKYDFNYFLETFIKRGYDRVFELYVMRQGARIIQMTLKKNGRKWILRDSMALLNFSLKKLTENFGVKHMKGDFDHKKINPKNWESLKPEWSPYLKNDCIGLYEVLRKYESFDLERYGISLRKNITSSQGIMRIFRKRFLKETIPVYMQREEFIRQGYYGGRTEIFQLYGEDLNYYDVNSLYPYAMKKYKMPVGVPVKSFRMDVDDFGFCFAEVDVPDHIDIPVLPYRLKTKYYNKLVFPVGKFSGWYTTDELRKSVDIGCTVNIIEGYKFQQMDLFSDFVDEFYAIKNASEKDTADYMISKLKMNGLYGKFGQRREMEKIVFFPIDIIGMEPLDPNGLLDIYKKVEISKSKHILPAISAYVTSYARLELYKYLEKYEPLYCDTDSIITTKKIKTGKKLGEMKLEMELDKAVFLRPKMYAGKIKNPKDDETDYIRAKGFPKDIRDTLTFETYFETLKSNDYTPFKYKKDNFATLFISLRRNNKARSMIEQKRSIKSSYDKRTICEDLCHTKPLKLNL